jgi:hypothetical protein
MQNISVILQEENTVTFTKNKCRGCRTSGHNIRKCNNNSVLIITSYYTCWFKGIIRNKFHEVDNVQFDSEFWYNVLSHPSNFNLKWFVDNLEISISNLRIINSNKSTSGKNKDQLVHLFISSQLESLIESIENGSFHIENYYTLKIIRCLKKYHCELSNGCEDAFINYYYEMKIFFEDSNKKIKLKYLVWLHPLQNI